MKNMWDERYAQEGFAYGKEPNAFIKQELLKLEPGKILFPAEGEGRNAVFAAGLGWDVFAFDISTEGRRKAIQLANECGVTIDYYVNDGMYLPYHEGQFDVIAFSYSHFPAALKEPMFKTMLPLLKTGGIIILEAFAKGHLAYNLKNPRIGGPKEEAMLYSKEELLNWCKGFEFIYLEVVEIELSEGLYHNGVGQVLRAVLRK